MDFNTRVSLETIKKQLKKNGDILDIAGSNRFSIKTHSPIYGFKKVYGNGLFETSERIANLIIPPDSIIVCAGSHKLRTDQAFVHSIVRIKDNEEVKKGYSWHSPHFEYRKHAIVKPRFGLNTDIFSTCHTGIHFFLDLNSAYNY